MLMFLPLTWSSLLLLYLPCYYLLFFALLCLTRILGSWCAGEPIFKRTDRNRTWPAQAGTWNHRAAAFYAAAEQSPRHENVSGVLARGLVAVKFVDHRSPDKIWRSFIVTHNSFHAGSGQSFQDYIVEATRMEAEWERYISQIGMQSQNPSYKSTYRDFILERRRLSYYCLQKKMFCFLFLWFVTVRSTHWFAIV